MNEVVGAVTVTRLGSSPRPTTAADDDWFERVSAAAAVGTSRSSIVDRDDDGGGPLPARLAVLVPFREDEDGTRGPQLTRLLRRLRDVFRGVAPVAVCVAEQSSDGRRFNRGHALNAAFLHLRRNRPGWWDARTLWCFHDCDMLPDPSLAAHYLRSGDARQAVEPARRAVALRANELGKEHPSTLTMVDLLGRCLGAAGRLQEAESLLRLAAGGLARHLGDDHPAVGASLSNLAAVVQKRGACAYYRGDYADASGARDYAEALYRRALGVFDRDAQTPPQTTLTALRNLGDCLVENGKPSQAAPVLGRVVQLRERLGLPLLGCVEDHAAMLHDAGSRRGGGAVPAGPGIGAKGLRFRERRRDTRPGEPRGAAVGRREGGRGGARVSDYTGAAGGARRRRAPRRRGGAPRPRRGAGRARARGRCAPTCRALEDARGVLRRRPPDVVVSARSRRTSRRRAGPGHRRGRRIQGPREPAVGAAGVFWRAGRRGPGRV